MNIKKSIHHDQCSAIVEVDGYDKCKHGFPCLPYCKRNPMDDNGIYGGLAPCLDEKWTEKLFPDTGKPKQPEIFRKDRK